MSGAGSIWVQFLATEEWMGAVERGPGAATARR
jgi:hypothetical protein